MFGAIQKNLEIMVTSTLNNLTISEKLNNMKSRRATIITLIIKMKTSTSIIKMLKFTISLISTLYKIKERKWKCACILYFVLLLNITKIARSY